MTEPTDSAPAFEDALGELQAIVQELEAGSVGLEDSMRRFERGTQLLRHCHQLLEQVEQRIEILTGVTEEGEPVVEAFDAEETQKAPEGRKRRRRPADDGSNDETLF